MKTQPDICLNGKYYNTRQKLIDDYPELEQDGYVETSIFSIEISGDGYLVTRFYPPQGVRMENSLGESETFVTFSRDKEPPGMKDLHDTVKDCQWLIEQIAAKYIA